MLDGQPKFAEQLLGYIAGYRDDESVVGDLEQPRQPVLAQGYADALVLIYADPHMSTIPDGMPLREVLRE